MNEKKELILQASMKVFSEQGFHNAKISKIAEIAGIGAGSVYLYFKSKESILEEIFLSSWQKIFSKLQELVGTNEYSESEKIKMLIASIIESLNNNTSLAKVILHEYRFWNGSQNEQINNYVKDSKLLLDSILTEGKKNNQFRKNLNVDLAIEYFVGGIWHLLAFWAIHNESLSVELLQEETERLLLNGLI